MAAIRLISTIEAAEIVGLSRRTLEYFRRSGGGPCYVKLGKRVLYDPEDLAAWIRSHKRARTKVDPV